MRRSYRIRVEGRTFDPTGVRAIEAVAAEFPGPDPIVVTITMRGGAPDRTVTLATHVDSQDRTFLGAIARTIAAHTRPR